MKKLSDFQGQKIAIHFPTYQLWLRRKEINPSDELQDRYWNDLKYEMCINPFSLNNKGSWAEMRYYIEQDYTILHATDFLEEEFVYGQEVIPFNEGGLPYLVDLNWIYISKLPNGNHVVYCEQTNVIIHCFSCRKINTERTEAITTAKELITKFDIKQEELFNN